MSTQTDVDDTAQRVKRIRELNDALRKTGAGGMIVLTRGIAGLPPSERNEIHNAIAAFDDFNEGDDPYGEHDFGAVEVQGQTVFFKVDYFDLDLRYHSPDPADAKVTNRVMTVMLADEY